MLPLQGCWVDVCVCTRCQNETPSGWIAALLGHNNTITQPGFIIAFTHDRPTETDMTTDTLSQAQNSSVL